MTRRHFLQHSAALAGALLSGCDVGGKSHISRLGKTYDYLRDPVLRQREQGEAQLVVRGVEFSGIRLQVEEWHNIRFVNCDFAGAYEIHPKLITQSSFEDCKFAGIFNLGVLRHVRFERCLFDGSSHVGGDMGSEDVTFESCEQMGTNPDANHWGSFGTYGEVAFIKCKAKWTNLNGETKHLIRDCDFEQVDCNIRADSGGSEVLIENSRLLDTFKMMSSPLRSLTIRDTTIGKLDLTKAKVKGDILLERVKAKNLGLAVSSARAITLRSVQVVGSGYEVFYLASNRLTHVLMEDCTLPYDPDSEKPWIGGAEEELAYQSRPPINQSVILRSSRLPSLDASYLNTRKLRLENMEVQDMDLGHSRIERLEISHCNISISMKLSDSDIGSMELTEAFFRGELDVRNTQLKTITQTGGTELAELGAKLKKDGSNIQLPR